MRAAFLFSSLAFLAYANKVENERFVRQLFPGSPFESLHSRIHDRLQQGGGLVDEARSRIHNRVEQIRNATKAATGCFQNEHGFKCCSLQLFSFMGSTFRLPIVERLLARVDLQKIVDKIVELVQAHFDTSFEVIVAPSDFASKNTFRGDLMCKTKTPNGKIVLVYATPVPYSTQSGLLRRLSEAEVKAKHWAANLFQVSELSFFPNRTH